MWRGLLYIIEMPRETKSLQINFRMRPALKRAADKACAAEFRSFASLVEKVLTEYLVVQGFEVEE